MNRGHVLESSVVQQMMVAGNPNWWSFNNTRRPPSTLEHGNHQSLPSWHGNQDQLPESWSQLLLGGLMVSEEDKSNMGHLEAKNSKMEESWEEQVLESGPIVDVKQENAATSYMFLHANQDQVGDSKPSSWSQFMPQTNSSITSCVTMSNNTANMLDFSSATKGNARHPPPDRSSQCGAMKKARVQPSCSTQSTIKVRKEKLGDRITALHQLVSPFGKTDTASVLLEAIGYIRFLQSQIEALSLPYLGNESQNMRQRHQPQHAVKQGEMNCMFPEDPGQEFMEEPKKDLRSRGLCLVPLSSTMQVGSENGADFWAPAAFGGGFQ